VSGITLHYTQPLLAGGVYASANDYSAILRAKFCRSFTCCCHRSRRFFAINAAQTSGNPISRASTTTGHAKIQTPRSESFQQLRTCGEFHPPHPRAGKALLNRAEMPCYQQIDGALLIANAQFRRAARMRACSVGR
jgi:hypothetical protein